MDDHFERDSKIAQTHFGLGLPQFLPWYCAYRAMENQS